MFNLLIVEDDAVIAESIKRHIGSWGYTAHCVENFQDVLGEFTAFDPHLVLLDISLPFYNGYHWCTEIRKISKVPVIFISSAADKLNIVMAVSMGGDDFIAKPFDLEVLTAKVQALLRRTYDFAAGTAVLEHRGAFLQLGDMTLRHGDTVTELSKNEFKILQTLMENREKAVSREQLMTRLWETDCYIDDNTLTVNITRLRKKLDGMGLTDFIITKKGVGYLVG